MSLDNVDGGKEAASSLTILSPEAEELEVGDKKVMVRPLKVAQLGKFSKAVQTILPTIMAGLKKDGSMDMMALINGSTDDMIKAVAIGCNESEEWVGTLDVADFVKLAGKVMVVNVDFFARRLPQMTQVVLESLAAVNPKIPATGGTLPSSD